MPKDKPVTAPVTTAPIEEHRKHAEEFLTLEKHKVKKPTANGTVKP